MQNFEFDNDAQTDGRSWDGIDTWNLFDKHQFDVFSQTLKTGRPEGMFCHKIIRD